MLFLICLEPLLNKRLHKATGGVGYQEHNNEEVDNPSFIPMKILQTSQSNHID